MYRNYWVRNLGIDYLNLAKATNGSIHTIEQDIINFAQMHDGEIIVIGKRQFKLSNGSFSELKIL